MSEQLRDLGRCVSDVGLVVSGVASLAEQDGIDQRYKSIALLSPDPELFWTSFAASDEARDGMADPIDQWSRRTILGIANEIDGLPVFPFEGPPYYPFSTWAQRAGVAWQSPSGLLVHAVYGLWISFRGGIALKAPLDTQSDIASPCETCPQPCLQACPVGALNVGAFNYPSCLAHVQSSEGTNCKDFGCLARRACPIGHELTPPPEQRQAHMSAFAKGPEE